MPRLPSNQLVAATIDAIRESGYTGQIVSPASANPRRFLVASSNGEPAPLTVYLWTLTFGGRPTLPTEWRIQLTGVASPFVLADDGPTVLMGYDPELRLFAGFDIQKHRTFTPGSSSVQIDRTELAKAEPDGFSFDRKSNDEIAVGVRPDLFVQYCLNAEGLHRYGREAAVLHLLNQVSAQGAAPPHELETLSEPRKRIIQEVRRLARLASFRQRVLFAYGNRCAVTRVQLRLVDAAHILPVGADGSTDHVRNGIALSPTYHRAFDAGLIYLDEESRMRLNENQLRDLEQKDLALGIDVFKGPLGRRIFLPPDPAQRPSPDFIRRGNRFRHIQL